MCTGVLPHGSEQRPNEMPSMNHRQAAGDSARTEAERATAAASTLERKAAYARHRATSFRQGAEGELATARAVAELTVDGWHVLHDRLLPHGGNIDHLVVGPAGVFVLDAKNWSQPAQVDDAGRLRAGRYSKQADAERLVATAATVEAAVRRTGNQAPVTPVLVITGEFSSDQPVRLPVGVVVVGLPQIVPALRAAPAPAGQAAVDTLAALVAGAFPPSQTAPEGSADETQTAGAPQPANRLFVKANTFLFVEPWNRSGRRRLYLNDERGTTLAFKDLATGEITVQEEPQARTAQAVLAHAHPGGLGLALDELPRIPVDLPAGRLLGALGGLWRSFLVGQHWRGGGKDRLYVTHALPSQGIFDLGHIDLRANTLYPSSARPLGKDLRPPERYLELTLERYRRR